MVLILLPHCCKISRLYLVPVPNYWTLTKSTLHKKWFFWSNPYKMEVIILFSYKYLSYQTVVTRPYLQYNLIHVKNVFQWHHGQKLWHHNLYFKISSFQEGLEWQILLTLSKLQSYLSKQPFMTLCIKKQFLSVFPDITKTADSLWNIAHISRTQGVSLL